MASRIACYASTMMHGTMPHTGFSVPALVGQSSPNDDDELFRFEDEESAPTLPLAIQQPWILLVVDDDQQVHEATVLTLRRGKIGNRPFQFLHAYSAAQAREVITTQPRIDLVLLDVVMETRDAGLKLVTELRGPMARQDLKILIRTGQPGTEREASVRERYPVDGYIRKTEQTYSLMMDVIGSLLLGTPPDEGPAS